MIAIFVPLAAGFASMQMGTRCTATSASDDHSGLCGECGCIAAGGCLLIEDNPGEYTCEIGFDATKEEHSCHDSDGIFCEGL